MLLIWDPVLTSGIHCYKTLEDKIHCFFSQWFAVIDFQDIQRCLSHFYFNLVFAARVLQLESGNS